MKRATPDMASVEKTEYSGQNDVEARAGTTNLKNYNLNSSSKGAEQSKTNQLEIEIAGIVQISSRLQRLEHRCHFKNDHELYEEANQIYNLFYSKLEEAEHLMAFKGAQSFIQDDDVWTQYEYNINDFDRIYEQKDVFKNDQIRKLKKKFANLQEMKKVLISSGKGEAKALPKQCFDTASSANA